MAENQNDQDQSPLQDADKQPMPMPPTDGIDLPPVIYSPPPIPKVTEMPDSSQQSDSDGATKRLSQFFNDFRTFVSAIMDLEATPKLLEEQRKLVAQIMEEKRVTDAKVAVGTAQLAKEQQKAKKLQTFSLTQIKAKIQGNLDEKIEQENKQVDQITQILSSSMINRDITNSTLAQAKGELSKLEAGMGRIEVLRNNLHGLLEKAFAPPFPEQPGHDALHEETWQLYRNLAEVEADLQRHRNAKYSLDLAYSSIHRAISYCDSALESANTDLYYRNTYSELNEIEYSQMAHKYAMNAQQHLNTAASQLPSLPAYLGRLNIPTVNPWGSLFFDNFWSDIRNIQMLTHIHRELLSTQRNVVTVAAYVKSTASTIEESCRQFFSMLVDAKWRLAELRMGALSYAMMDPDFVAGAKMVFGNYYDVHARDGLPAVTLPGPSVQQVRLLPNGQRVIVVQQQPPPPIIVQQQPQQVLIPIQPQTQQMQPPVAPFQTPQPMQPPPPNPLNGVYIRPPPQQVGAPQMQPLMPPGMVMVQPPIQNGMMVQQPQVMMAPSMPPPGMVPAGYAAMPVQPRPPPPNIQPSPNPNGLMVRPTPGQEGPLDISRSVSM